MMNKKVGISVLTAAITLGTAGSVFAATSGGTSNNQNNLNNVIGIQKAETIALQKVPGGTVESIELDRERGQLYYEVDIDRPQAADVDVHINALNGSVIRTVTDDNDDDEATIRERQNVNNANLKVKTNEQAAQIAKAQVSGTVTGIERDEEDGRIQYEVDLRITGGEATVEIDAATGKVTTVDKDFDNDEDDNDND